MANLKPFLFSLGSVDKNPHIDILVPHTRRKLDIHIAAEG